MLNICGNLSQDSPLRIGLRVPVWVRTCLRVLVWVWRTFLRVLLWDGENWSFWVRTCLRILVWVWKTYHRVLLCVGRTYLRVLLWDGRVRVRTCLRVLVSGMENLSQGSSLSRTYLRIPVWVGRIRLRVQGEPVIKFGGIVGKILSEWMF